MLKLQTILARLREPSTMAGLSVLGVLIGLPAGAVDVTLQAVTAVAAAAAVLMPERKE
jgi:hypothetical protein